MSPDGNVVLCQVPNESENTLVVQLDDMASLAKIGQAIERRFMPMVYVEGEAGLGRILILPHIPCLELPDVSWILSSSVWRR